MGKAVKHLQEQPRALEQLCEPSGGVLTTEKFVASFPEFSRGRTADGYGLFVCRSGHGFMQSTKQNAYGSIRGVVKPTSPVCQAMAIGLKKVEGRANYSDTNIDFCILSTSVAWVDEIESCL